MLQCKDKLLRLILDEFNDGNKRTAWTATHRFLWKNGQHVFAARMEAADFMVLVDNQKPDLPEIARWLKGHNDPLV